MRSAAVSSQLADADARAGCATTPPVERRRERKPARIRPTRSWSPRTTAARLPRTPSSSRPAPSIAQAAARARDPDGARAAASRPRRRSTALSRAATRRGASSPSARRRPIGSKARSRSCAPTSSACAASICNPCGRNDMMDKTLLVIENDEALVDLDVVLLFRAGLRPCYTALGRRRRRRARARAQALRDHLRHDHGRDARLRRAAHAARASRHEAHRDHHHVRQGLQAGHRSRARARRDRLRRQAVPHRRAARADRAASRDAAAGARSHASQVLGHARLDRDAGPGDRDLRRQHVLRRDALRDATS